MSSKQIPEGTADVEVENVGGISSCDVDIPPGVTVLTGRNATNRTSLLTALTDVLGGSEATIRNSAEEGQIALDIDDKTYTRTLTARAGSIARGGEPYTEDADLVNIFVSLLQQNPIRKAVSTSNEDELRTTLRELLMEPVDTDAIEAELDELNQRRTEIRQTLNEIERKKERLPQLESDLNEKQDRLEELEEKETELEEQIEAAEIDREESEEAEELFQALETARSDRNSIKQQIEEKKETLELARDHLHELEEKLGDLRAELEDTEVPDRDQLDELRDRESELSTIIEHLQAIRRTNQAFLNADTSFPDELTPDQELTEQLTGEQQVECWTCGSEVSQDAMETRVDTLYDIQNSYEEDLEQLRTQIQEIVNAKDEVNDLEREISDTESEIRQQERRTDEYGEDIERLQEDLEAKEEEIADLEQEVEETEDLRDSEIPDLYEELSDVRYEMGQVESRIEDLEEQIDDIETDIEDESELEDEIDQITAQREELQSRIETVEREIEDAFNDRMEDLIEILDYENIERIWIERKTRDTNDNEFQLHVVRSTEEGAAHQSELRTLSESERSLVGLVVALVGYTIHGVAEEVPFMLIDSVEQFDAERINRLLEYIRDDIPYLVVALLPEDADAVEADTTITADALN